MRYRCTSFCPYPVCEAEASLSSHIWLLPVFRNRRGRAVRVGFQGRFVVRYAVGVRDFPAGVFYRDLESREVSLVNSSLRSTPRFHFPYFLPS